MANDHATSTSEFLMGTQAVAHAGRRLRYAVGGDRETVEYAVIRLERAAQLQETGRTSYQAFMFAEAADPTKPQTVHERASEDSLAGILADVHVANVLLSAGQALGEEGATPKPELLDDALLHLDRTNRVLEGTLASPMTLVTIPGRFGFTEPASAGMPAVTFPSSELSVAIGTFRSRSDAALTGVVCESKGVVTQAFTALNKLDGEKVLGALGSLGEKLKDLPKAGRLLRLGVEKLQSALNALWRVFGGEALAKVRDKVKQVWNDIRNGKYAEAALQWVLGIDDVKEYVKETLAIDALQLAAVDRASQALPPLLTGFAEQMAIAGAITAGVTVGGAILAWFGWGWVPLALASAYTLIMASVVLVGMDYTGSHHIVNRVRGVRDLATDLRPA